MVKGKSVFPTFSSIFRQFFLHFVFIPPLLFTTNTTPADLGLFLFVSVIVSNKWPIWIVGFDGSLANHPMKQGVLSITYHPMNHGVLRNTYRPMKQEYQVIQIAP